jgi:adenylosuccinate synthase
MVTVIVGTQWGDEGKGKIIDTFSPEHDIVARYQGGANAGHTVISGDKKFVFHLIPSGVLHTGIIAVLGNGVVIDPASFLEEVDALEKNGIRLASRLFLAGNAHITLPYHKVLDQIEDKQRKSGKLGTTGRGIGTTYTDKFGRTGIRVVDFLDEDVFRNKLKLALELKNYLFTEYYREQVFDVERLLEEYRPYRERIKPFVINVSSYLNDQIASGKKVLAEGAQGTFLDIDFGTYPYVTASSPISGGACTGLGISPKQINRIIGVAKAYTTRVGMGPFPTELHDALGEKLRTAGNEFGATTGRPRRCGWFDSVLVNFAGRLNGLDELVVTKLDVLTGLEKIKLGVRYYYDGAPLKEYPLDQHIFANVEVEYLEFDGWTEDLSRISSYSELPAAAKKYLTAIEDTTGVKISHISVGSSREQIIAVRHAH